MEKGLKKINQKMATIYSQINETPKLNKKWNAPFFVGVDLGTSSIVLIIVDQEGHPIYSASQRANVVRDGLVVNYSEAVWIVKQLKEAAEAALEIEITQAAGVIPPGTIGNNKQVVGHIIESAEMEVTTIVDEPTAAALALGITSGAVVDVGGGTTGISVFKDEKVVFCGDEATGGTQMTLVLSGALGLSIEDGEDEKRKQKKEHFYMIRPVIEKMALITQNFLQQYNDKVEQIYLVGGATYFPNFESVFLKTLSIECIHPDYPEFVTPLGIALASRKEVTE